VALVAGGLALLTTGLPRRMALGANGGRGSPGLLLVVFVSWLMLGFWLAPGAPATDTAALAIAAGSAELGTLATTGLQAGLLTFGGAYTAIPFLQDAATGPAGWMTGEAMLSGIAIGGVLPTPMVMVGTWVGFAGGGLPGALLLTLGIFLPAFALPLLLHERLEALTARRSLHTFLDGVTAAVAGLVVATAVSMTAGHLDSQHTTGLASTTTAWLLLWRWRHRLATPAAMLASGLVGLLLANVT
jgi:chromate transporter